jgi:hypothetical protein
VVGGGLVCLSRWVDRACPHSGDMAGWRIGEEGDVCSENVNSGVFGKLAEEPSQFREDGVIPVGLIVDPSRMEGPRHNARTLQALQLTLHRAASGTDGSAHFPDVMGLVGVCEQQGEQRSSGVAEQCSGE